MNPIRNAGLTGVLAGSLMVSVGGHAAEPPTATAVTVPSPDKSTSTDAPLARGADRLDLDATVVTGNRELPKVLYIVPWKKADQGDLPEQPFNTLLDEALTPVDRDEFRREVAYHAELTRKPETAPADAVPDRSRANNTGSR